MLFSVSIANIHNIQYNFCLPFQLGFVIVYFVTDLQDKAALFHIGSRKEQDSFALLML